MTDGDKLKAAELENERLRKENQKLYKVIEGLNHTLNRLIGRYISEDKIA